MKQLLTFEASTAPLRATETPQGHMLLWHRGKATKLFLAGTGTYADERLEVTARLHACQRHGIDLVLANGTTLHGVQP